MTTKEKLLELFESSRDIYLSGEDIAQKLAVSRTAVWKAVKALQNDGYSIDAVTNKGYSLSGQTDILSSQGVAKYLCPEIINMKISVVDTHHLPMQLCVKKQIQVWQRDTWLLLMNRQQVVED